MTLGSVEHEGPTTRMSQKRVTCQASPTSPFTSSCITNLGSLCLGPPRHHCLQPPHGVQKNHCFCTLLLALGSTLANFSSIIPVFLAWHCAFSRFCLFRFRLEILVTLEAGTFAGSRTLVLVVRFSRGIFASRSRDLVVCIPHSFLLWTLRSRCGRN